MLLRLGLTDCPRWMRGRALTVHVCVYLLQLFLIALPLMAMDAVRSEIGLDQAVEEFGMSGEGVLVAVMDRGIDWQNQDFRNEDGSTRIEYIYDLTDDSGAAAADNAYGMGTIYTQAQINAALQGVTEVPTRDAVGHGTTTTGIACGNGRNLESRRYRGVAPKASIIAVKIVTSSIPAHDDQEAEQAFWDPNRIPVAINFIRDKASELDMPCVMLLNLGSTGGPTDGTSSLCQKIDSTVGEGIPGLVFVTGTGDDGGAANRASGSVPASDAVTLNLHKGGNAALYLDLWYDGDARLNVTVETPNASYGPYAAPVADNGWDIKQTADLLYYQLGSENDFYSATNGKRELWLRLDGPTGDYSLTLSNQSAASVQFDATLNPSRGWEDDARDNNFLNFIGEGSTWDGASANNNIAPTCYVLETDWVDINGADRSRADEGGIGEIWSGSSAGPTFDGRLGTDVAAPGHMITTSYNPDSYWGTFDYLLVQDGNGMYGKAGAVSAASPIVTGLVALILQKNPTLDAVEVREILRLTARRDAFTGDSPSGTWGYGKLDAYAALQLTMRGGPVNDAPALNKPGGNVVAGEQNEQQVPLAFAVTDSDTAVTAEVQVSTDGSTWTGLTTNTPANIGLVRSATLALQNVENSQESIPPYTGAFDILYTLPASTVQDPVPTDFSDSFWVRTKDSSPVTERADLWSDAVQVVVRTAVITTLTTAAETNEDAAAANHDAQFSVRLAYAPAPGETVTVELASGDPGEGAVSQIQDSEGQTVSLTDPPSVTFTEENWNQAYAVTVAGQDDRIVEFPEDMQYEIGFAVTSTLSDHQTDFHDLWVAALELTNVDDDVAGFTVTETDGGTAVVENGGTDTFEVALDTRPRPTTREPVTLNVEVTNTVPGAEDTVDLDPNTVGVQTTLALQFTYDDWAAKTVTVTGVDDDTVRDGDGATLTVSVDDAQSEDTYEAVANQTVDVTCTDEDTTVASVQSVQDGGEAGPVNGQFEVALTKAVSVAVEVTYTVGGTAAAGRDFTALSGTVSVPADTLTASINVPVLDDQLVEGTGTVTVTLTNADHVKASLDPDAADITAAINIADDDTATVSVEQVSDGGEAARGDGQFKVVVDKAASVDVLVTYGVGGTAATDGADAGRLDYTALSGTVSISAGAFEQTFDVAVLDDEVVEGPETVVVDLVQTDNVRVAVAGAPNDTATVTIADDDTALVSVTKVSDAAEPALNGQFQVTSTKVASSAVAVDYTVAGDAMPGSDYTALSGQVIIPALSSSQTIDVGVIDDNLVELDEDVDITLTGTDSALVTLEPAGRALTAEVIIDSEDTAAVSVAVTQDLAEPATNGVFQVMLSGDVTVDVTVTYEVTGGTATAGTDYTVPATTTVVIPQGSRATTATFQFDVVNDLVLDADMNSTALGTNETIVVTVTGTDVEDVTAAAAPNSTTTAEIVDDEPIAQNLNAFTKAGEAKQFSLTVEDQDGQVKFLGSIDENATADQFALIEDNFVTAQGGTLTNVTGQPTSRATATLTFTYAPPPADGNGNEFRGMDVFYLVAEDTTVSNLGGMSNTAIVRITVGTPPWFPMISWQGVQAQNGTCVRWYEIEIGEVAGGSLPLVSGELVTAGQYLIGTLSSDTSSLGGTFFGVLSDQTTYFDLYGGEFYGPSTPSRDSDLYSFTPVLSGTFEADVTDDGQWVSVLPEVYMGAGSYGLTPGTYVYRWRYLDRSVVPRDYVDPDAGGNTDTIEVDYEMPEKPADLAVTIPSATRNGDLTNRNRTFKFTPIGAAGYIIWLEKALVSDPSLSNDSHWLKLTEISKRFVRTDENGDGVVDADDTFPFNVLVEHAKYFDLTGTFRVATRGFNPLLDENATVEPGDWVEQGAQRVQYQPFSDWAQFTVATGAQARVPAKPTLHNVQGGMVTSATLSWDGVTSLYNLRAASWSSGQILKTQVQGTSYQLTNLSAGTYYWSAEAVNSAGKSGWATSKTFTIEPPATSTSKPSGLRETQAPAVTANSVTFSFEYGAVEGYGAGAGNGIYVLIVNETTLDGYEFRLPINGQVVTNTAVLQTGETYWYYAHAISAFGAGPDTGWASYDGSASGVAQPVLAAGPTAIAGVSVALTLNNVTAGDIIQVQFYNDTTDALFERTAAVAADNVTVTYVHSAFSPVATAGESYFCRFRTVQISAGGTVTPLTSWVDNNSAWYSYQP